MVAASVSLRMHECLSYRCIFHTCRITGLEDLLFDAHEQPRDLKVPDVATLRGLFMGHKKKGGPLNLKAAMSVIFTHNPNLANSSNIRQIESFIEEKV